MRKRVSETGEKGREKESEGEKSRDNEESRIFHVFINVYTLATRHMSQFLSFFLRIWHYINWLMGLLLEVFIQIHVNNGKRASIVFKNLQIPFKSQKRASEKGERREWKREK